MLQRILTLALALGLVLGGISFSQLPALAQEPEPSPEVQEPVDPGATLTDTVVLTSTLTVEPTEEATEEPTEEPTEVVTEEPTEAATEEPTEEPTEAATEEPTEEATEEPTEEPTEVVTEEPTEAATEVVTEEPAAPEGEVGSAAVVNPPAQTSHVLLQNTSSNSANVSVSVYNTSGSSIFSDSFSVAGKGARTLHASSGTNSTGHLYMNLSASQSGMVVESTERLVAVNVNYGSPTVHHAYEGLDSNSTSTDVLLPSIHWADSQWSLVSIQNAGSAPANIQIKYYNQSGTQIGTTKSVNGLAVGEPEYRNARTDVGACTAPPCVGSMRVTSTNGQPLAVAAMETLSTYAYSYIGIPVSAADTTWSFPSVHRATSWGQYSHILVQNTQSTDAKVTLTYFNQNGQQVNQFTNITIKGNGALTFHTTNTPSTDGKNYTPTSLGNVGAAKVQSTNGVKVVATMVETLGPAPYAYNGLNSSASGTSLLVPSAHRNTGFGQYTHTLIQNSSTTQSNNVRITYYNQNGSVANTFTKNLPPSGSLTFHTTSDLSSDGKNYTPTSLGNVGSADVVSLDGRPVVAVVVETISGLPSAYNAFK